MNTDLSRDDVSGQNPLTGQVIGISISDSEDLKRRGYLPAHVDRAMANIATLAVASGARIGYGGDLRQDGFTRKLFQNISELYKSHDIASPVPPCIHYLAHPIWEKWDADQLLDHVHSLEGIGEVVFIHASGDAFSLRLIQKPEQEEPTVRISARTPMSSGLSNLSRLFHGNYRNSSRYDTPTPSFLAAGETFEEKRGPEMFIPDSEFPLAECRAVVGRILEEAQTPTYNTKTADSFTVMRLFMAADEDARVALGGKTSGYLGHYPGIAEETLYSLAAGKPVMELAAFGGCAGDVAQALLQGTVPDRDEVGDGYSEIMERLAVGSGTFRRTLDEVGLGKIYPEISGTNSLRTLGSGVLRCLVHSELRQNWPENAEEFLNEIVGV